MSSTADMADATTDKASSQSPDQDKPEAYDVLASKNESQPDIDVVVGEAGTEISPKTPEDIEVAFINDPSQGLLGSDDRGRDHNDHQEPPRDIDEDVENRQTETNPQPPKAEEVTPTSQHQLWSEVVKSGARTNPNRVASGSQYGHQSEGNRPGLTSPLMGRADRSIEPTIKSSLKVKIIDSVHHIEPQEGTDVRLRLKFPKNDNGDFPTNATVLYNGEMMAKCLTSEDEGQFIFSLHRVSADINGLYIVDSNTDKHLKIQITVDDQLDEEIIQGIIDKCAPEIYRRLKPHALLVASLRMYGVIDDIVLQDYGKDNKGDVDRVKVLLDHVKVGTKQAFIDFCLVLHENCRSHLVTKTMGIKIEKLLTHSERMTFGRDSKETKDFIKSTGDDLTLEVEIWGQGEPSVEWYHGSTQIPTAPPAKQTRAMLHLPHLTKDDTGMYEVKLKDARQLFAVRVKYKPEIYSLSPSNSISVEKGSDFELSVRVNGYPTPEVSWIRKGKIIENSLQLCRRDVKLSDTGKIWVTARNEEGYAETCFQVQVYEEPKFLEYNSIMNIERGKPFKIEIPVQGHPDPLITWTQNGETIYTASGEPNEGVVVLNKNVTTEQDDGIYRVTARNDFGEATAMFQLKTVVKPGLKWVSKPYGGKVELGSSLELKLQMSGHPEPAVTFRRNGNVVDPANIFLDGDVACLFIRGVSYKDGGTYRIEAENEEASCGMEVDIVVEGEPVLTNETDLQLRLGTGETLHVDFKVEGNPQPKYSIFHNGVPKIEGKSWDGLQRYEMKEIDFSSRGLLCVHAKNKYGEASLEFNLDVYGKPLVKSKLQKTLIEVPESGSLELSVEIEGDFDRISWYFNDIKIHKDMIRTRGTASSLTLHHLSSQQSGKYRVTALNSHGNSSKEFDVCIIDRPVILALTPIKQRTKLGSNIELKAKFDGIPKPKVYWTRNREKVDFEQSDDQSTVRLDNITEEKDGKYTMVAKSRKGRTTKSFYVTVEVSNLERIQNMPERLKLALDRIVGREKQKEEAVKMYKAGKFNLLLKKKGKPVPKKVPVILLTGNSGTGKTLFASALAELMFQAGLVGRGKLVTANRAKLIGQYVSSTTEKTSNVLNEAKGGTLLVQNAHELTRLPDVKDYGREAMRVIMESIEGEVSTTTDRPAIIFTGSYSDLTEFLNQNYGSSRRITHRFHFPDYSLKDISNILLKQAEDTDLRFEDVISTKAHIQRAFTPESIQRWNAGISDKILRECETACKGRKYDENEKGRLVDMTLTITDKDLQTACRKVSTSISATDRSLQALNEERNVDRFHLANLLNPFSALSRPLALTTSEHIEPGILVEEESQEEEEGSEDSWNDDESETEDMEEDRESEEESDEDDELPCRDLKFMKVLPSTADTDFNNLKSEDMEDVTEDGSRMVLKKLRTSGIGNIVPSSAFVIVEIKFEGSQMKRNVQLGKGELRESLELAITSLKLGEVSYFRINPSYLSPAGSQGTSQSQDDAMLSMDIYLKYWTMKKSLFLFCTAEEDEQEQANMAVIIEFCTDLKENGNTYYNGRQPQKALEVFLEATDHLNRVNCQDNESEKQKNELLAILYRNAGIAALQMDCNAKAWIILEKALELEKTAKGFYLQGKALLNLGKKAEALQAYTEAKKLDPSYRKNNKALQDLERQMQEEPSTEG